MSIQLKKVRCFEFMQNLLNCRLITHCLPLSRTNRLSKLFTVTDFSKKSGDFGALSATDIRVLALTYMMEANVNGTDHLKEAPTIKRTTEFYKPSQDVSQTDHTSSKMPGFYMPSGESDDESADEEEIVETLEETTESSQTHSENLNIETEIDTIQNQLKDSDSAENLSEGETLDSENEAVEDDDEGWITPANYSKKKEQLAMVNEKELIQNVEVACMTSDFAMQVSFSDSTMKFHILKN